MFYSGQKIVCVSTSYDGYTAISNRPTVYDYHGILEKDKVYTVRSIRGVRNPRNPSCILLMEIIHPRKPDIMGFPAPCFRPLCDKKTDISELKKLLITDNLKVDLTNVE